MEFQKKLDAYISEVEEILKAYVLPDKTLPYHRVLEAMDYSLSAGGKRIRPILTLEFCQLCGGDRRDAYPFAAAIEMVHTYSLIHDDLPCMDNDDYRRGRLTNHKVYGEAIAVLAGDGLLTEAFAAALSAKERTGLSAETIVSCTSALAEAAGCGGMLGGQVIDMESEHQEIPLSLLDTLHRQKTAALIRGAVKMGCLAGGASREQLAAGDRFAEALGLAFQITDDILDVTGDAEKLGKPIRSDETSGKVTYVTALGLEPAKEQATELTRTAIDSLGAFQNADFVIWLAKKLLEREN